MSSLIQWAAMLLLPLAYAGLGTGRGTNTQASNLAVCHMGQKVKAESLIMDMGSALYPDRDSSLYAQTRCKGSGGRRIKYPPFWDT